MTRTEEILNRAMAELESAHRNMKKMMECTGDQTASLLLEIEFDNLETACREFASCQFGMSVLK